MHCRHFQFYNSARTSDSGFSDRWKHFLSKFSSFYFSMFYGDYRPQFTIWILDVGNTMLYWWSHHCSLNLSFIPEADDAFKKSLVSDILVFFRNFFGSIQCFKFLFCFTQFSSIIAFNWNVYIFSLFAIHDFNLVSILFWMKVKFPNSF